MRTTNELQLVKCEEDLVQKCTGEVIATTKVKFSNKTYDDYIKDGVKYLEPQTAVELEGDKLLQEVGDEYIVERKFDGHRDLCHLGKQGNRNFSRRVSKQTNWFSENTDQIPQIRDIKVKTMAGSVLDGELLLPVDDCTCREVQGVTGALPDRAIQTQLEKGFAFLQSFDILYYKGVNVSVLPLWKRKVLLAKVIHELDSPFIQMATIYVPKSYFKKFTSMLKQYYDTHPQFDYQHIAPYIEQVNDYMSLFTKLVGEGYEGVMVKKPHSTYHQKRTKNFIKVKPHLTFDVVIMGYEEPEHYFEGKTLDEGGTWDYWEDAEDDSRIVISPLTAEQASNEGLLAVTKFYAYDWIGAVKFGVWKRFTWDELTEICGAQGVEVALDNEELIDVDVDGARMLVEVGQTSGFNDETRGYISENKFECLNRVIEVEAQCIINEETGSLQHPRFKQFREDKNQEACIFEDHLLAGGKGALKDEV